MLIAVLCMAVCTSCSDNEPDSPVDTVTKPNDNDPNDKDPGDKNEENDDAQLLFVNKISGTWKGKYYDVRRPRNAHCIDIEASFAFTDKKRNRGVGTLKKSGYSFHYAFDFQLQDSVILCKGMSVSGSSSGMDYTDNEKDIVIIFEYHNGMLFVDAPQMPYAYLGKDEEVLSDINGLMVNHEDLVYKVWLHENGKNILDFRKGRVPKIFQLVEAGSDKYDYFDSMYVGASIYNFLENSIDFHGSMHTLAWTIKEITEDKMILRGQASSFDDVFYAASSDIVPIPEYNTYSYAEKSWGIGGRNYY